MKYYIIAGEASGDLHGANLMKSLVKQDKQAQFRFWGGELMEAVGGELRKHYKELAFMGFVEVAMNIRTIAGNLKKCKADILDYEPDALILIDYPGFNMRIAEFAKKKGIKVIYYISPQIWAWKQNRVHKLKRDVDRMLCILPFEKEFYAKFGVEVDFVGHPLIDAIQGRKEFIPAQRKLDWGLDGEKLVLAMLPGSRKQEIKTMLPVMIEASKEFPDHQLVLAAAPSQDLDFYKEVADLSGVAVVEGKTYDLLEVSEAAMVTSGTATLEAALFEVPEVVCYKGNWFSYWIARQLIKVKYISLVNLIADKVVVTELIQAEMNSKRLTAELQKCLRDREYFDKEYKALKLLLGGGGASDKAASIITQEVGL